MNGGIIVGHVYDCGVPVENAQVCLSWLRGGGEPITIYSADADSDLDRARTLARGLGSDMPPPVTNLFTFTDRAGLFALEFQWWGGHIEAVDAPRAMLMVLTEERTTTRITARMRGHFPAHIAPAVSMSQVSAGLITNPTSGADLLGVAVEVWMILREIELPPIFVASPSADMLALIGDAEIYLH